MIKKILFCCIILTFTTLPIAADSYPGFDFEHESHEFQVLVNGKKMPVAHVKAFAFSSFDLQGESEIEIRSAHDIRWVDIRPKNENIQFDYTNHKIKFTLDQPGKWSIELNGESTYPLYLFANQPKDYERDENTIVFSAGKVHQPGKIELQSNQTVIIEKGAVVKGYIEAKNAENIKILGQGIMDGSEVSKDNRLHKHRIIQLEHCKNVVIDGLIIVNSATWTIEPMFCENVTIKDIKMLNWRFGSDGIDMVGCQKMRIENSFIRANDDCVVIKTWGGKEKYPKEHIKGPNVSDIKVMNSVFWNMAWGNALEIGFELRADLIQDVLFQNCDIIHVTRGAAMSIHNGDYATIRDITYRDIRVENAQHKLIDLAVFLSQYSVDRPESEKERERNYLHGAWDGVQKVASEDEDRYAKHRGHIKNITFENISILDGPVPFSVIAGYNKDHLVEDVIIRNFKYYSQKVESLEEAKIDTSFVKNVVIR